MSDKKTIIVTGTPLEALGKFTKEVLEASQEGYILPLNFPNELSCRNDLGGTRLSVTLMKKETIDSEKKYPPSLEDRYAENIFTEEDKTELRSLTKKEELIQFAAKHILYIPTEYKYFTQIKSHLEKQMENNK